MSLHRRLRQPRHRRQFAAALGSLGLASTLAFSGLVSDGIETTEASWNDAEKAAAIVKAAWPEAFVSVVAGSAKSSDTAHNGLVLPPHDVTYESSFRWTQQLRESPLTTDTTSDNPGSNEQFKRVFDQRFQGVGNPVSDSAPHSLVNSNGTYDPYSNALHNWRASTDFSNNNSTVPSTERCLVINESYSSATNNDSRCAMGTNFAAASNTTTGYGFSMATGSSYITHLNSAHLYTGVTCSETSAVAHTPTGRVDVGLERGGINPYLAYTGNAGANASRVRTIWANGITGSDNGFSPGLSSGTISPTWEIAVIGSDPHARVMPVITQESSEPGEQPYAISEISAYVEIVDDNLILPSSLRAKMYFVLSRSECGVKRTTDDALPTQRPVFPATLPGGNGLTPYSGSGFTPAAQQEQPSVMRGLQASEALAATLPSTTTLTSPAEHTLATNTTTSAPPNPGETTTSTGSPRTTRTSTTQASTATSVPTPPSSQPTSVSTSPPPSTSVQATSVQVTPQPTTPTSTAAPEIVIPDEPGTLAAAAQVAEVDTITAGEADLVVVVDGDTVPTDARAGARALETWLDGGTPGTTWATFTSDDPDRDGWRWAAINQRTGTVVFVR